MHEVPIVLFWAIVVAFFFSHLAVVSNSKELHCDILGYQNIVCSLAVMKISKLLLYLVTETTACLLAKIVLLHHDITMTLQNFNNLIFGVWLTELKVNLCSIKDFEEKYPSTPQYYHITSKYCKKLPENYQIAFASQHNSQIPQA